MTGTGPGARPAQPARTAIPAVTIGVIRVVTLDSAPEIDAHAELIARQLPGARFVSRCIPDQPHGVHNAASFAAAVPQVVALGLELARECDAIVVSCVDDPGVSELRSLLTLPVIGAGGAIARHVPASGSAVLLNLNDDIPAPLTAVREDYGQIHPDRDITTLELRATEVREAYVAAALAERAGGPVTFLAVCTGMDAEGLTEELTERLGEPVVGPLAAVAAEIQALFPHLYPETH